MPPPVLIPSARTVDGLARSGSYTERVLGEPPVARPAVGEAS